MVAGLFSLHLKVEAERLRLADLVKKHGQRSPIALAQSRKLDKLIAELQKGGCYAKQAMP